MFAYTMQREVYIGGGAPPDVTVVAIGYPPDSVVLFLPFLTNSKTYLTTRGFATSVVLSKLWLPVLNLIPW